MRRKMLIAALILLSTFVAAIATSRYVVWDGGFSRAEYQFKFQDIDGKPIPGIRLRVENDKGDEVFNYPVSDFYLKHIPKSDADGVLTFHHMAHGPEFGGSRRYVFFTIPIARCDNVPVFNCRFLYGEHVVYSMSYNELDGRFADEAIRNAQGMTKVTRLWKWPEQWDTEWRYPMKPSSTGMPEKEVEFPVFPEIIVIDVTKAR